MLSIQQHKERNAKYANETKDTALVQVLDSNGHWTDYSRTTIERARAKVLYATRPLEWRVVDWITRDEIDLTNYRVSAGWFGENEEKDYPWKGGPVSPKNSEAWLTWRAQCHAELDAYLDQIDFKQESGFTIAHTV